MKNCKEKNRSTLGENEKENVKRKEKKIIRKSKIVKDRSKRN